MKIKKIIKKYLAKNAYEKSSSIAGIESILHKYGFVIWDIPYIGKFADESINRINFVDVIFVNVNILNSLTNSHVE